MSELELVKVASQPASLSAASDNGAVKQAGDNRVSSVDDDEQQRLQDQAHAILVPIEERRIDFYGDQIAAALVEVADGETEVFVPVRPICEYLGLSWRGQLERLQRHPVLSRFIKGVRVTRAPLDDGEQRSFTTKRSTGGPQEVICLPVKYIPGWLFGIDATRIKPELVPKILLYQTECFEVLWQAFQADVLLAATATDKSQPTTVLDPNLVALEQIKANALAVAHLADQQIVMQTEVKRAHNRLDEAGAYVKGLERRLNMVEKRVSPPNDYITGEQAAQLSASVKALAEYLTSKGPNKNHYQGIFSEIYRRFGVTEYKLVRLGQFMDVIRFLDDWREAADKAVG